MNTVSTPAVCAAAAAPLLLLRPQSTMAAFKDETKVKPVTLSVGDSLMICDLSLYGESGREGGKQQGEDGWEQQREDEGGEGREGGVVVAMAGTGVRADEGLLVRD